MATPTAVSAIGIVASPILEVALDRLVAYLSRERVPPTTIKEELQRLRLAMANVPVMLRKAERIPSPAEGLLDLLRQLKEAAYAADDLVDELEYQALHHQVEEAALQLLADVVDDDDKGMRSGHAQSAPEPVRSRADPGHGTQRAPHGSHAGNLVSGGIREPSSSRDDLANESVGNPLAVARDFFKAFSDLTSAVRSWAGESSTNQPSGGRSVPMPTSETSGSSSSPPIHASSFSTTGGSVNRVVGFSLQGDSSSPSTHSHEAFGSSLNKIGLINQQQIASASIKATPTPDRIRKIAERLDNIAARLEKAINLEKLDNNTLGGSDIHNIRLTTSTVNQQKVYGRDGEKESMVTMLLDPSCEHVSILPVLGIGGVGKTTLAQCVFGDERVVGHFDTRVWICVSDHFDRMTITRELVASTSTGKPYHLQGFSLDSLERDLMANLVGKKFLLVLDDVWTSEWVKLLPALESGETGSKIVITAREEKVVDRMARRNKILLKGLEGLVFWMFFKKCAFGTEDPDKHPILLRIGKQIAEKLHGSPLAARTLGRLLNENLNDHHWINILKSKIWELGESAGDIMPVLKLSYMHLPAHLQRCFAYCSIFPKDYRYDVDKLVQLWMAQGLIQPKEGRKRIEDIGRDYFDDLLSRSFFEQHTSLYWSSKGTYYVMHDLLHDLALSVSFGECFVYEGMESGRIPRAVRHLCMRSLPELNLVFACKNLHTLVSFLPVPRSFFDVLKSLRVLDLANVSVEVLPDVIGDLIHLRYLDLSHTPIKVLPESLCRLYHMQTLILPYTCTLPKGITNLINLRHFTASVEVLSMVSWIGRLTSLQELKEFHVKRSRGHDIGQLKEMSELGGQLRILNLEIVESKKDALKSSLMDKDRINKLQLQWNGLGDRTNWSNVQEKVLEGLHPHCNLKVLEIKGYMGRYSPSWLATGSLQNIQSLCLIECNRWHRLPRLGQLPFLQVLYMEGMDTIVDGGEEVAVMFPSLRELWLENTSVLFQGMSVEEGRKFFPLLSKLHIRSCNRLRGLHFSMLSALEELNLSGSPVLDSELPSCLQGLYSLTTLNISRQELKSLPRDVMSSLRSLEKLRMKHCPELTSLEGLHALDSLKHLEILSCPKLTSWLPNGEDDVLPAGLHTLQITHCGSLKSLPTLPVGLHSLKIKDCRSLESSTRLPVGLPRFTSLQRLVIDGCPKLPPLASQRLHSRPW